MCFIFRSLHKISHDNRLLVGFLFSKQLFTVCALSLSIPFANYRHRFNLVGLLLSLVASLEKVGYPPPLRNFRSTLFLRRLHTKPRPSRGTTLVAFMFMLYGTFSLNLWRSLRILWFRACRFEIGIKIGVPTSNSLPSNAVYSQYERRNRRVISCPWHVCYQVLHAV